MNKNNFWLGIISFLIFVILGIFAFSFSVHAQYNYTPMEPIPGFAATPDFPTFILNIYKFGIWTVGIAALLMVTVGGFMYLTSAGNMAKNDTAKGVIKDALIGLILAMIAYLILFVINPDLVKINISLSPVSLQGGGGAGGGGGYGTGTCTPITSGNSPCSVSNLQTISGGCFGSNINQASAICNAESGGIEGRVSGVDRCRPGGEAVSYGLFQFNLSANRMGGFNCPSAFSSMYTGTNKNCTITNPGLYQQCIAAASNPTNNIQAACALSKNGTTWSKWGANSKCKY